jgi:hypothetical protein
VTLNCLVIVGRAVDCQMDSNMTAVWGEGEARDFSRGNRIVGNPGMGSVHARQGKHQRLESVKTSYKSFHILQ